MNMFFTVLFKFTNFDKLIQIKYQFKQIDLEFVYYPKVYLYIWVVLLFSFKINVSICHQNKQTKVFSTFFIKVFK